MVEILGPPSQPLHRLRPVSLFRSPQLRNLHFHQPHLALDSLTLVSVPKLSSKPRSSAVPPSTGKLRHLLLDAHLKHVLRHATDESLHRVLSLGFTVSHLSSKHRLELFLHPRARWYSLHGVDLLSSSSPQELSLFV